MKRFIMEDILNWYRMKDGRILFICGAPKVGKTWLIGRVCRENNHKYIYLSAMEYLSKSLGNKGCRNIKKVIMEGADTLVIADIDTEYALRTMRRIILKLRSEEELPDFMVIMEGTIIDREILLRQFVDEEYVRIMRVFPMSFEEFKEALLERYERDEHSILKTYLITGGLPECVDYFIQTGDFTGTRRMQRCILSELYKRISKKEKEILRAVSKQLESDSTSFTYRDIKQNAREREYGKIVKALEDKGIVHKIYRYDFTNRCGKEDYKLYIYDVGLLGALMNIDERIIMEENDIYKVNNKLLVREFIIQQFQISDVQNTYSLKYWIKPRAKAKLPIIFQSKCTNEVIAAEIVCGRCHSRSIESFAKEYKLEYVFKLCIGGKTKSNVKNKNRHLIYYDEQLQNISKLFLEKEKT